MLSYTWFLTAHAAARLTSPVEKLGYSKRASSTQRLMLQRHIGQVRLGGSVRSYFSVRTFWNSTGCCKLDLCPLHHSCILQNPRNNFVCSDMASTPQLQSSSRWLLWRYRSPQDVSAGYSRCHGDNPWNFIMMWSFKGPKLFSVL